MVLGEWYEILRELGKGAQGRTWLATDVATMKQVVVKELLLEWVDGWKGVELFEREAAALRTISHPGVPVYIDSFQVEDGGKTRFVIIQEYVDGRDLRTLLDDGLRMDEVRLREFLRQMAEMLRYLHGLSPAVIHRDIKPSNIMQHADGRFLLVDFGAVQAVQTDRTGGSTVIGTSGYMPAEQLVGRASPASDLYALAATAVHLASGVRPLDMPMRRMRIAYRAYVDLSVELTTLLDAMLEPSVSLRLSSAQEVLDRLEKKNFTRREWPHQRGRGAGAGAHPSTHLQSRAHRPGFRSLGLSASNRSTRGYHETDRLLRRLAKNAPSNFPVGYHGKPPSRGALCAATFSLTQPQITFTPSVPPNAALPRQPTPKPCTNAYYKPPEREASFLRR